MKNLICEEGNHPFTLTDADLSAYKKFGFEPIPLCSEHQHQLRLTFRNDRFLHRRKCSATGENIISMYDESVPFPVYSRDVWFSDRYDPLAYGRVFDFDKPFFEQFAELNNEVPHLALATIGNINSDYCNMCVYNKNCYLIFGGDRNEDSMFGSLPMYCRNCVDCDWTTNCELCYNCAYSEHCYNSKFVFNSKDCYECAFIDDCIGCNNCILSYGLRNKSYYIENKPYSKDDFLKLRHNFYDGSYKTQSNMLGYFMEMRKKRAVKYANILNCENVSGDIIFNSKNCHECFECIGSEDCRDCYTIFTAKDCFSTDYVGTKSALCFNAISTDTAYRIYNSWWAVESSDIDYSIASNYSKNLFGCVGSKHNEYCILNKQYSREAFDKLKLTIIKHMKRTGEWGRFFPKWMSPFPYNKTTASFFFPMVKDQAIQFGFKWKDEETRATQSQQPLPDNINITSDEITGQALTCELTGKNYRIIPQELEFYRRNLIPVPRRHPDTRYSDRLAMRNSFKLFDRACVKCGAAFRTTYAPDRPEMVYCERCYLASVY
jgi:hypothetical protein